MSAVEDWARHLLVLAEHKQMPTSTEFGRAITNIVKREIFSVLRALNTKIQELEAKVASQQLQIDQLLSQNESVLVVPTVHQWKND